MAPTVPIEQAYLAHRTHLLRFLRARGAGDASEDLLQELWFRLAAAPAPDATRIIASCQHVELIERALNELGGRAAAMFRRHRIEGVTQRQLADEFGVSLSTVESDLRRA